MQKNKIEHSTIAPPIYNNVPNNFNSNSSNSVNKNMDSLNKNDTLLNNQALLSLPEEKSDSISSDAKTNKNRDSNTLTTTKTEDSYNHKKRED